MNLIWIRGPASVVRGLEDIDGLSVERETAQPMADGWRVSALATDEAIAEIRNRGAEVDVVMDNARLEQQVATVLSQVQRGPRDEAGQPIDTPTERLQDKPTQDKPTQDKPTQDKKGPKGG